MKGSSLFISVSFLLAVTTLVTLGAGCWDRIEIERLTMVNIIGIDSAGPHDVLVTFQNPVPRMLVRGQGGGGGGGGKPYFNISVRGRSVSDAVRIFEESNSRVVRFKQLNVIILGEDLCRRGISPSLDFFTRRALLRRSIYVLVAKGRAVDVLADGEAQTESLPAIAIKNLLERREDVTSTRYPVNLAQLYAVLTAPAGIQPVVSSIELTPILAGAQSGGQQTASAQSGTEQGGKTKNMTFAFKGAGVFKGDRLLAFIGPLETRGVRWVKGEIEGGTINIPGPQGGDMASLIVSGGETRVTPMIKSNQINFQIDIREEGYVSSILERDLQISREAVLRMLKQKREQVIKQEAMSAINKAKELHDDFLGLGQLVYEKYPKVWKQVEKDWNDTWLPRAQVEVKVTCQIKRNGLTADPAVVR